MPRVRFIRDTKPSESGSRCFKAGEVVDDFSIGQVKRWVRRAACVVLNDDGEPETHVVNEVPGGWVEAYRAELLARGENPEHVSVLIESALDEARRGRAQAEIRADVELALQNARSGDGQVNGWDHDDETGAYSREQARIDPVLNDSDEVASWILTIEGERVGPEFDTLEEAQNAADKAAKSGD